MTTMAVDVFSNNNRISVYFIGVSSINFFFTHHIKLCVKIFYEGLFSFRVVFLAAFSCIIIITIMIIITTTTATTTTVLLLFFFFLLLYHFYQCLLFCVVVVTVLNAHLQND